MAMRFSGKQPARVVEEFEFLGEKVGIRPPTVAESEAMFKVFETNKQLFQFAVIAATLIDLETNRLVYSSLEEAKKDLAELELDTYVMLRDKCEQVAFPAKKN